MCCAFAVRNYYFEAKVRPAAEIKETIRIIVAKTDIPAGSTIAADAVEFQDVSVPELPKEFITDFAKVYRRIPAYPIPAGCPVCEDLLIPLDVTDNQQVTFTPAGSQFITLQVDQIRYGHTEPLQNLPLASVLQPGEQIDIRIVPKQESQGKLAELKSKVLHSHQKPQDLRNEGELVLENVPVHKVSSASARTRQGNSVELLLEKKDIDALTAASRKGLIRIVLGYQPAADVARRNNVAGENKAVPVETETAEVSSATKKEEPAESAPEPLPKTAPEPKDITDIEKAQPLALMIQPAVPVPVSKPVEKKPADMNLQPVIKIRNEIPADLFQSGDSDPFMQPLHNVLQKSAAYDSDEPKQRSKSVLRFRPPQYQPDAVQSIPPPALPFRNEPADDTQKTHSPFEMNSRSVSSEP
jgi:Flp pilus assembly protein CpaB